MMDYRHITPADMKRCIICGEMLAIERFNKDKLRNDGRKAECSKCTRLKDRIRLARRAGHDDDADELAREYSEMKAYTRQKYGTNYHKCGRRHAGLMLAQPIPPAVERVRRVIKSASERLQRQARHRAALAEVFDAACESKRILPDKETTNH